MASSAEDNENLVPVTVLTGFLGSGKTTLLNHILTATHGKKIAVIENEFGDVGIDDELLQKNSKVQADEEIIEMMNGCICCTVRQDLITVLSKLAKRVASGKLKLDGIVIETTGLADPAPVAQTFFVDDAVKAFARLDGIVTLIDAKHIELHLDEEKPEGVENEAVEQVAFADRLLLNKIDLVSEADLFRIESRLKGINAFAPIMRTEKAQVSVDSVLNIKAFDLKKTLDMDPEFLNTDGEHEHDNSVSSISIIQPGNVDLELVQKWVGQLLQEKGAQIYRMKGVLSISNADEKFVYQAVHMLFRGNFDDKWEASEPRESKLVFIGKNLDEKELRDGFNACIDTPEVLEKRIKTLRFAMGTKVECKTGGGWVKGEVVAHMYRDEFMPPGMVAPYQVKLDSGELIWAPEDVNNLIRKA
jgi:G3E family GTPase